MSARRERPTSVTCTMCGWRSRRTRGECACYDEYAMSCSCTWGLCRRCKGRMRPAADLKRSRQEIAEADRYYAEHKAEIDAMADAVAERLRPRENR